MGFRSENLLAALPEKAADERQILALRDPFSGPMQKS